MLEIEDVTLLSDGKSFVSTVGGRRFKVIEICEVNGTFGIFLIVRV
jgi:Lon protease-like protein